MLLQQYHSQHSMTSYSISERDNQIWGQSRFALMLSCIKLISLSTLKVKLVIPSTGFLFFTSKLSRKTLTPNTFDQ